MPLRGEQCGARGRRRSGLGVQQVERVFRDIDQKRKTTAYLHLQPDLMRAIPEVGTSCPATRVQLGTRPSS